MKVLISIETQEDLIVVCRLMNILRRKGVHVLTFAMSSVGGGYALTVLLETADPDMDHLFHFLRRTEGVRHVAYYRQHETERASFVLMDGEADARDAARIAALLPGAKLVFAGHGKALLETSGLAPSAQPGVLPFTQVRTTRGEKTI